jgi:hypothetical protein
MSPRKVLNLRFLTPFGQALTVFSVCTSSSAFQFLTTLSTFAVQLQKLQLEVGDAPINSSRVTSSSLDK